MFLGTHSLLHKGHDPWHTQNNNLIPKVCFTDLDQGSEMTIFELILTTFTASIIFEAAGEVAKIGSSLKLNQHEQI
jgi:hypothetical protein